MQTNHFYMIDIIISKNNGQRKGAFEQRFSILSQEIDALSSRLGPFYPDGFFAFIWQITETGGLSFASAASRQALARLRSWLDAHSMNLPRAALIGSIAASNNRHPCLNLQLENQLHDP